MSHPPLAPRLAAELDRLFGPAAPAPTDSPEGTTRCLGLELLWPAQWPSLAAVWQAVQNELGLPEPAITVNGRDALGLWFALQAPVTAAQGQRFLDALRQRYLPDWPSARWRGLVTPQDRPLPQVQPGSGLWSAFVAPDLAPVFTDEPGLDLPPNPDGQAERLARLRSATASEFEQACERLGLGTQAIASAQGPAQAHDMPWREAARVFLGQVMHDATAPLALRLEAAKALLNARD